MRSSNKVAIKWLRKAQMKQLVITLVSYRVKNLNKWTLNTQRIQQQKMSLWELTHSINHSLPISVAQLRFPDMEESNHYQIPIRIYTHPLGKQSAACPRAQHNDSARSRTTLPDTLVATLTGILNVGLQDSIETLAINNIGLREGWRNLECIVREGFPLSGNAGHVDREANP